MTIEVFPDSPPVGMSPRISFSHDLNQSDAVPVEEYIRTTSSSTIDFDFCVFRESFSEESSSADELFFNGQILPIQIRRRLSAPPPLPPPPLTQDDEFPQSLTKSATTTATMTRLPPVHPPPKPRTSGEPKGSAPDSPEENKSKSFWRFKRSASLNCGSGYGTLCPLPLLSRSNSTGSSTGSKRSAVTNNGKQGFFRNQSSNNVKHNYSNQPAPAHSVGRPPLKRSGHGFQGNGVKFNPVLHVPSATLFGFGSIFSIGGAGKERSRKKN